MAASCGTDSTVAKLVHHVHSMYRNKVDIPGTPDHAYLSHYIMAQHTALRNISKYTDGLDQKWLDTLLYCPTKNKVEWEKLADPSYCCNYREPDSTKWVEERLPVEARWQQLDLLFGVSENFMVAAAKRKYLSDAHEYWLAYHKPFSGRQKYWYIMQHVCPKDGMVKQYTTTNFLQMQWKGDKLEQRRLWIGIVKQMAVALEKSMMPTYYEETMQNEVLRMLRCSKRVISY